MLSIFGPCLGILKDLICLCLKGYSETNPTTFDAFVFHSNFNYDEVRKLVPEGPAITLLRDPVALFDSGYSFFGWDRNKVLFSRLSTLLPHFPMNRKFPNVNLSIFSGHS